MRVPDDTSGGPNRPRKTSAVPLATPTRPPATPKPKRKRPIGPILSGLVFCAVVALGIRFYLMLSGIGHVNGGNVTPTEFAQLLNPEEDKQQFPGKDRVNVLLIGKDYNRDSHGMPFTTIKGKSLGVRADSIMILSLDMATGKVSSLSVPRDTKVTAPDGQTGKINGTYARGGAPLLIQTLQNLLGVTPDYFIAVKPDAVKAMVNKLGGVEVESIDAMNYDDNWGQLHVHLPKGKQTIDGEQAVGFARFREVKPGVPHSREEGDPRRMARQQQLIRAMTAKGKSLSNLLQLDDVAKTALGQLETNMSPKQMFALVLLFRSLKPDEIQSASLQGTGTPPGRTYFFIPDEKKKVAMVDWLLKGDESAANRLTVVAVENGTTVPGAASRVAEKLRAEGYDAASAGTVHIAGSSGTAPVAGAEPAPGPGAKTASLPTTQITFAKASVATRAAKIAQLLGVPPAQVIKQVKTDTAGSFRQTAIDRADVTIVLGSDLAASFGPRSASVLR